MLACTRLSSSLLGCRILSDPPKRAYYDKHGSDGMDMVEVSAEEVMI